MCCFFSSVGIQHLTVSSSLYIFTPLMENFRDTGRLLLHVWGKMSIECVTVFQSAGHSCCHSNRKVLFCSVLFCPTTRSFSSVWSCSIWSSRHWSSTGKDPTYCTHSTQTWDLFMKHNTHNETWQAQTRQSRVTVPLLTVSPYRRHSPVLRPFCLFLMKLTNEETEGQIF